MIGLLINRKEEIETSIPSISQDISSSDPIFPFFIYYNTYDNDFMYKLHWHENFEIIYVETGTLIIDVNNHQYIVTAGESVFINSAYLHSVVLEPSHAKTASTYAILINPSFLYSNGFDILQSKYISPIISGTLQISAHITFRDAYGNNVLDLVKNIINISSQRGYGFEFRIKSILFDLFYYLLLSSTNTIQDNIDTANEEDICRIKKILSFIYGNYHRKITIRDLADLLSMSEGYFNRYFKHFFKKTPIEFINCYRISQASMLLRKTNKKEIDIALDVGFDNFGYFINVFKNIVKCTPSAYRKNKKSNHVE